MAEAVDAIAATVRAGGTILVHGDYDVDGQCATALLTRALRAAGADVVGFVPHRLRDGYDFGPAGLAAAQRRRRVAGRHLRLRHHRRGRRSARRGRRASASSSPTTTCPAPSCRRRSPSWIRSAPTIPPARARLCGTGIAFKLVQALVPALGLPPNLPYHLLDLVALATVADVVPLRRREPHPGRATGSGCWPTARWPGLRGTGRRPAASAGKELRAGHMGYILGPRLNAGGRIGDAADGLRLLLTDDPAEAVDAGAPAGGAQRRAAVARPADAGGGPGAGGAGRRSRARRRLRARGRRLASRAWSGSSRRGSSSATGGRRFSSPSTATSGKGSRPEHLPVRSPRGAARLRRPAGALRRPPDGRRAHHPAGPAGRVPRAVRRHRPRAARARTTSGPEQRVDLELRLGEARPTSSSGSAATWSRAGRATRAPCSACGACGSPAGRASGAGHLKGTLDDGGTRLPRHRLPVGGPGALAGRRPGRRGVPAGVQRVERPHDAAGAAVRAVAARGGVEPRARGHALSCSAGGMTPIMPPSPALRASDSCRGRR